VESEVTVLPRAALAIAIAGAVLIACSGEPRAAAGDQRDSLALLYGFDARSGDVVRDLSGRRHHGAIHGATWTAGRHGQALAFDGVDDYVQAVGYYPFGEANGFTIEAWVKLTGQRPFSNIVTTRNCCAFRMMITPTLTPFYDPGVYSDVDVKSYTFEIGRWTHYALAVAGGATARVLIDGKVVSDTSSGVPSAVPSIYEAMLIGGDPDGTFTNGVIDELRIYTRALTNDEIEADMNSSATAFVLQRAERLVNRLGQQGGDTAAAAQKLRQSRDALARTEDESAQALAGDAEALARAALLKQEGRPGPALDAGAVLLWTLFGVSAFGTLLTAALIWSAWKAAG
jgi:hypothetical protein